MQAQTKTDLERVFDALEKADVKFISRDWKQYERGKRLYYRFSNDFSYGYYVRVLTDYLGL